MILILSMHSVRKRGIGSATLKDQIYEHPMNVSELDLLVFQFKSSNSSLL